MQMTQATHGHQNEKRFLEAKFEKALFQRVEEIAGQRLFVGQ